jgi:hypothetical protein
VFFPLFAAKELNKWDNSKCNHLAFHVVAYVFLGFFIKLLTALKQKIINNKEEFKMLALTTILSIKIESSTTLNLFNRDKMFQTI